MRVHGLCHAIVDWHPWSHRTFEWLKCLYDCAYNYVFKLLWIIGMQETIWSTCCCRNRLPDFSFRLNSGTPPLHCSLRSIVKSLAPLSISVRLRLIACLCACFFQSAWVARSVFNAHRAWKFALAKKIDVLAAIGLQRFSFSLWIGPLLEEVEFCLTRRCGS